MNAELLYTSAPQGLKQGSRGFCTVLSTQGMPINLASKLESLSGYRHVYPSGTPEDSQNPVAYSHLKFSVGGRSVSVLSRVAAYGLDYSQRTNKIAHHVVLDDPMPPSGPAALLLAPGFMRHSWDGQCQTVIAPAIPDINVQPNRCQQWESLTGDAGWGGRIAEAWLDRKGKPIFVLFSIEQSGLLLGLMAESISLLPPSKRWQATFGTYITNLPPDVDCKVRCVIAGSDEARMASARGEVIDLSRSNSLGVLPPSEGVRSAREGIVIGSAVKEAIDAKTLDRPGMDISKKIDIDSAFNADDPKSKLDFDLNNPFGERHPPRLGSLSSALPSIPPTHPSRVKLKDTRKQSRQMIVAAMALCLLIIGGGIAFMFLGPNQITQLVPEAPPVDPGVAKPIEPVKPEDEKTPGEGGEAEGASGADKGQDVTQIAKEDSTIVDRKTGASGEPEQEHGNGPISTSEFSEFEASDFHIDLSGFLLQNEKDRDSPIPLHAGIPDSTLSATLNLENLKKKLKENPEKFESIRRTFEIGTNVQWKWEQLDGNATTAIDNSAYRTNDKMLSTTLTVNESFTPGSHVRASVAIRLESNIPNEIKFHSKAQPVYDYITILVKPADFLKEKEQCYIRLENTDNRLTKRGSAGFNGTKYEVRLDFPESNPLTFTSRLRDLQDTNKSSSYASDQIAKLLKDLNALSDKRDDVDKSRKAILSFLRSRQRFFNTQFRNKMTEIPVQNRPFSIMSDLIESCEANLNVNPEFGLGWNPSKLNSQINNLLENKKVLDSIEKKIELANNTTSTLSPMENEFFEFKRNWKEMSIEGGTPEIVFQKLVDSFYRYEEGVSNFGKEISAPLNLGALRCFSLATTESKQSSDLPTKPLDRQKIQLWTKLKIANPKSESTNSLDSSAADSGPSSHQISPETTSAPAPAK